MRTAERLSRSGAVRPPTAAREGTARAELLAAAARTFAEHGYHGVSVRDLAREIHRAPATIYSHFDSKEEILYCLQRDAFDALVEETRDALRDAASPRQRLRAFVLHHVRFVAAHPDLMRVLVREASALPSVRREAIRRRKEAYFDIARSLVAALGQEVADSPDPGELERRTYCVFGMLNWTFAWYRPDEHGEPERLAATITRTLLSGLGAPSAAPGGGAS